MPWEHQRMVFIFIHNQAGNAQSVVTEVKTQITRNTRQRQTVLQMMQYWQQIQRNNCNASRRVYVESIKIQATGLRKMKVLGYSVDIYSTKL